MSSVVFLLESSAVDDQGNLVGEELRDHIAQSHQDCSEETGAREHDGNDCECANPTDDVVSCRGPVEAQMTFEGTIPKLPLLTRFLLLQNGITILAKWHNPLRMLPVYLQLPMGSVQGHL